MATVKFAFVCADDGVEITAKPNPGTEKRKLAAIMFTDKMSHSALAQRDEALALELLEEQLSSSTSSP